MIHLASASNESYSPGMLVMVASSLVFLDPEEAVTVHLLSSDITPNTRRILQRLCDTLHPSCTLVCHPVTEAAFQHLNPGPADSRMCYVRLLMGSFVTPDKAIYLDSDILVQRDLSEAWRMEMQGRMAIACGDEVLGLLEEDCPWPATDAEKKRRYFNSGFMVINLRRWREKSIESEALRLKDPDTGHYKFHDQTILNYLMRDDVLIADAAWNVQYNDGDDLSSSNLHFLSPHKPWLCHGNSLRYRIWRLYYRTVIASPLHFARHWRTFYRGMSQMLLTRIPPLRIAFCAYLRARLLLVRHSDRPIDLQNTLNYYTTGPAGPAFKYRRDEEDRAFAGIRRTLQQRLKQRLPSAH